MREERVDVVNEEDVVVGSATLDECHRKGLPHRIAATYVISGKGVVLQRRSEKKLHYPGRLDHAAAGHVASGESYEEAAARELEEELGVSGELQHIGKKQRCYEGNGGTVCHFFHIFVCHHDGPFTLQEGEVAAVETQPVEEIQSRISAHPGEFAGGFLATFPIFRAFLSKNL